MTDDATGTNSDQALLDQRQLRSLVADQRQDVYEFAAALAELRIPLDLIESVVEQIVQAWSALSDPKRVLHSLQRFFGAARNPLAVAALFDRDPTGLPILLTIFSGSQHLSDILINDPESYDALRLTAGQPIARGLLVRELRDEVTKARSAEAAMRILRRFKRRETLRIAYGDIIAKQDLQTVTSQISYVADAICQAALSFAEKLLEPKYAWPLVDGRKCQFVVLSLGKLGGNELNYSSDIDLIMIYEVDGELSGNRKISHAEYFQRLTREFVKLLSETTELGAAFRVDLRLRPDGGQGPLVRTANAALSYYDIKGRTWERQALIKARPTAGHLAFGRHFLAQLNSWVYPSRLTHIEISSIQSLRRRIERDSQADRTGRFNVKTGAGGIRDIEFIVQFLQLLHGRYFNELQTTNTLEALERLQEISLITNQEYSRLDQNYRWLRRLEHRLQIMFDLQTHTLPDDEMELYRLALRMGEAAGDPAQVIGEFNRHLAQVTQANRNILNHLLQDAFAGDQQDQQANSDEIDLVLDPNPDESWTESVLSKYRFEDCHIAYKNLAALATEDAFFLPQARCRHFLASIAQPLLEEIGSTPQPQETLVALNRVSQNIGGKAVLWELFSNHSGLMRLFVRMCAACPYLCNILASHPGMIDGLLDSLLMQELPTRKFLKNIINELTSGAEDIELIIHAFKDSQHLRVGVRDIQGRDPIWQTHRALSDIAEVCLQTIVQFELTKLTDRYGQPMLDGSDQTCEFVVLAMGKLGGREPNYHSDLDVMFLYQGNGSTDHVDTQRRTSNQDFFSRLAANVTKCMTSTGPYGRLFELDSRLRPTGKSGSLAVSFAEFERYFAAGGGQLWERQALCKARPVTGSSPARRQVRQLVAEAIRAVPWSPEMADEIRHKRLQWQEGAADQNLKRASGGTVDIEFVLQMLQLKHATDAPQVLQPGTIDAGERLCEMEFLSPDDWQLLKTAYQTFRLVEARIRLMDLPHRHDLPTEDSQLRKLTYLLDYQSPSQLIEQISELRRSVREMFDRLFDRHATE